MKRAERKKSEMKEIKIKPEWMGHIEKGGKFPTKWSEFDWADKFIVACIGVAFTGFIMELIITVYKTWVK